MLIHLTDKETEAQRQKVFPGSLSGGRTALGFRAPPKGLELAFPSVTPSPPTSPSSGPPPALSSLQPLVSF